MLYSQTKYNQSNRKNKAEYGNQKAIVAWDNGGSWTQNAIK